MKEDQFFSQTFKNLSQQSFFKIEESRDEKELSVLKNEYLKGNDGLFQLSLEKISEINNNPQLKKEARILLNDWKKEFLKKFNSKKGDFSETKEDDQTFLEKNWVSSLEGKRRSLGRPHPISRMIREIKDFFVSKDYQVCSSPEIETVSFNFDKLNVKKNHPARDWKDTFYINQNLLLRTHTSSIQPRILEMNSNKEIKAISFGKVYRRDDDDATHSFQYTNLEIIVVGKRVNILHLKGTLEEFLKTILNKNIKLRFRNSFFPFTEPSFEVDSSCFVCLGKDQKECSVCKGEGWIEILGAGMIHHKILKSSGYQKNFSGFAAGVGVERIIMIANSITDIREFYSNDLRFLKQGKR